MGRRPRSSRRDRRGERADPSRSRGRPAARGGDSQGYRDRARRSPGPRLQLCPSLPVRHARVSNRDSAVVPARWLAGGGVSALQRGWRGADFTAAERGDERVKLAFSAWAMREWPVERQIALVQRSGYVGICLVSGAEFPFDAMRTDRAERERIRRLLDEARLAPTAIASHVNLLEADTEQLDRVRTTL